MKNKCLPTFCNIRFFHAFPSPIALDVYIEDKPFAKNVLYEDLTVYKSLLAQDYTVYLCKHREKEILYQTTLNLRMKKNYTLILFPDQDQNFHLLLLIEPSKEIPEDMLLARTINLTTLSEPIKHFFNEVRPEFKKLHPGHFTTYLAFKSDTYHQMLYAVDAKKLLYEQKELKLKPSRYYAFYIIGGIDAYPIKIITSIEGSSLYHFETS